MAADNSKKLLDAIKKPDGISDRYAGIAKDYVRAKMMDGFTIGTFCKGHNLSTKTWYDLLEKDEFKAYISQLQAVLIPDDERQAYEQMKKHLLKIPYMQKPTSKDIELFLSVFSYVVEADKQERMQALGISDGKKSVDTRTVEERKASLFERLKS